MKITVGGLNEVAEHINYVDCAISIVDPGYEFVRPAELDELGEWVLNLEFDDSWIGVESSGDVFCSEDNLQAVADFLDLCQQHYKQNLLIHCFQGVSRSTAIAVVAYAYLGEPCPYRRVLKENYQARPNPYIFELAEYFMGIELDLAENPNPYHLKLYV